MRVAVFGGSFHPPHVGHALLIGWLLWTNQADEVWVVPTGVHPLDKRDLPPLWLRVRWCETLCAVAPGRVKVLDVEGRREGPSYTLDLLRFLAAQSPSVSLRLVVGADILGEVHRWHRWEEIARDFTPLVVGRQGYPPPPGLSPQFPAISSTDVRARLAAGESLQGLVFGAVESELVAHFRGAPLRRSALLDAAGVRHGFTLRAGGSALGGHLDLRPRVEPELDEDWRRVLLSLGATAEDLALLSQVHGAEVSEDPPSLGCREVVGQGDALLTGRPGQVLAVRVADCVPVLLAAGSVVGAVHAGWRGLAAGVISAAVNRLRQRTSAPIVAAVGPCAGASYEVGPEVVHALRDQSEGNVGVRPGRGDRSLLDLREIAAAQLRRAGVAAIDQVPGDTLVDGDLWSHRRDGGSAGRGAGLIRCPE